MVTDGSTGRGTRALRAEIALEALSADLDTQAWTRAVIEQVLVFTDTALAAVYLPDESGDELRLACSAGVPRTLYSIADRYPADGDAPVAAAHRAGAPLWLTADDLTRQAPAALQEAWKSNGAQESAAKDMSLAVLPLRGERAAQGCLLVVGDGPDGFGAADRHHLEVFAAALADRPPPRPPTLPAQDGSTAASSFTLAMDSGRVDVDDQVLELFGLDRDAFDGRVETLLAQTVPEDLPTLMSVVEPGHMAIGDRELDFRIRRPSGEPKWLRLRGRVLPPDEGLPPRLLGTVVDTSDLRSRAGDVFRVQRLAAVLAAATTVRDVGQAIVTALRHPLKAHRVALAEVESDRLVATVLDPPEPEAWPEVWRTEWRSEWPDAPIRAMPTVASALQEGRLVFRAAGAELEPALAEVGPGGLAVLPLPAAGRTVGVCLIGWDEPHAPGSDERALLTAAATLAGQELVRVHALDAEHELVGTLQRTLLPRSLPDLPGGRAEARYLPTTVGLEVGGDWYDVIPRPDSHVALVIGDVQGHNAGAATLMGQMRTALRAYAVEGHPPDVVVSHANRLLVGMESDLFATCVYVDVDMEEGTAWCVRAGHLPPVLRHPDGRTELVETEGGPPLGVLAEADFPMTPLRLQPGALLVLTTDGLVESSELDIDDGLRQLSATLGQCDPAHLGLVADALLGRGNRNDDVALLLLRYDGMAVRPLRESWTIWRVPEAPRHARRFIKRTLRAWNVTRELDTVLLVVSELVTNALVHTDGQVRLELTLINNRLRVAVTDASPRTPVKPTSIGWEATGGRGILLVQAVSDAWGTLPVSGGKQVWSEIEVG
uniref:SpoIIE family protein phosphatase n=1 Tax=Streptomyces odontomachi TaxID=2944940 RepID=UPI00210EAFC9|nr:SpoIIE family protein phosphatase [Streptomyces sp. ODS25]